MRRSGQCLCGAVRVAATTSDDSLQACHCIQCQRWTGGGPLFSIRVTDLEVSGTDNIAAYRASEWGERAFCATCGTTLYWRFQDKPVAFVAPGLFDDQSGLTLREEIFVDRRPDWFPPWPEATQSTEAEELKKLHDFLEGEAP